MKLCSITVWYNPDETCLSNILTYSSFVETCYIIDNSDNDNSQLTNSINNAVYLPNLDNLGIAKALNIGCSNAIKDGFEWCVTMDQDSSWSNEQFEKYLCIVSSLTSDRCVSFVPNISVSKNSEEVIKVNKDITSGNIIKLSVWKKLVLFTNLSL